MDRETRGAIQTTTQRARRLLRDDFCAQLEGDYDIMEDGRVPQHGGPHLTARQQTLRERIVAAIEHKQSAGMAPVEAVADFLRDAAFTTLNRFVALKLLEARGLVQECVTRGDASSGFAEFCGLAPGLRLPDGSGYRLFLECIFDELSTEVKILFDRRDPASALWPTRATLDALLALLNAQELAGVWAEDETIGWVYQYFNGQDERRQMREESQAPRNSRELAVRNQFFTPRYIVQFLVDNTLGRMWLEMRHGPTRMAERYDYLVHPEEVDFRLRPAKDPRDLRILDPACGSGHFLLYAFDLLQHIYQEAWDEPGDAPPHRATGRTLREDYPAPADLHRAMPTLVLENNLHGIDIDPRCAQIAALALWLRAQRAWDDHGIQPADRPLVRRTHIVVAEPMPGERRLVDEFAAQLDPPLLRDLFRKMVDETRLAGELGALLRIEDAIAEDLARAREKFTCQQQGSDFLPGLEPEHNQGALNLSGIGDDSFFQEAETRIAKALQEFAEAATGASNTRRHLFADDSAQGLELIEILRENFDIVLMNPPFGDASLISKAVFQRDYPKTKNDIYAAFIERGIQLLHPQGLLGAITSRTGFFLSTFQNWREKILLKEAPPKVFADLGYGVLDSAVVEVAAYSLEKVQDTAIRTIFFRVLETTNKELALHSAIHSLNGTEDVQRFAIDPREFQDVPGSPFAYWLSKEIRQLFVDLPPFEADGRMARQGGINGDDFRWLRLWTEVTEGGGPHRFVPIAKGGNYSPFYADVPVSAHWDSERNTFWAFTGLQHRPSLQPASVEHYFRPGLSWPVRAVGFSPSPVPRGCIFSARGYLAMAPDEDLLWLLALMSSTPFEALFRVRLSGVRPEFVVGVLASVPIPDRIDGHKEILESLARRAWAIKREIDTRLETSRSFLLPALLQVEGSSLGARAQAWGDRVRAIDSEIALIRSEIDKRCFDLYGIGEDDRKILAASTNLRNESGEPSDQEEDAEPAVGDDFSTLIVELVSWAVGAAFGRFDVRIASGTRARPRLPEPFEAFPVCSAGMLTDDDTQPVNAPPKDYPLAFPDSGILVDDPGHPQDFFSAVRLVFDIVFMAAADERWSEVIGCIGGKEQDFRSWLRSSFFDQHLKRYSRSRRRAPIYWQIGTPSGRYSVWLYAHRLTRDSLFEVLDDIVAPKLAHEERQLRDLRAEASNNTSAGKRRELEARERLVEELRAMLEEVRRVAPLWNPSLDDGVMLTLAPLWRLVPQNRAWQKELKSEWTELVGEKYEWAHIAIHLWPERVVPKCAANRSLAIAHGLEDAFWVEDFGGRWTKRTTIETTIRYLEETLLSQSLRDTTEELRRFTSQHIGLQTRAGWWVDLKSGRHDDTPLALALWPERVLRKARSLPSMLEALGLPRPARGFDDRMLAVLLKRHKPRHTADDLEVLETFCAYTADATAWYTRWADFDAGRLDKQPLARFLHPRRVVAKALEDRTFAAGHNLARWFWLDTRDGLRRLGDPAEEVAIAVAERESPAVKAALKALIEAPAATSPARRERKARSA